MKRVFSTLLTLSALWGASLAQATPVTFYATLNGGVEAPPNNSQGSGSTMILFDIDAHIMEVIVHFAGLTGTTTASHVHCCTTLAGSATAGVATELPLFTGFPTGVTAGDYDHTFDTSLAATWNPAFVNGAGGGTVAGAEAAFLAGMLAGKAYLNVHSSFRPAGEIRGFLQVPEPGTLALAGLLLAGLGLSRRTR